MMDKYSNIKLRRKKNNKLKSFFKGLKCTKPDRIASASFQSIPVEDLIYNEELEDISDIKVQTFSKFAETTDIITYSKLTQTSPPFKRIISEQDVDYFKKILENNSELHKRDILIETRRLHITRVVNIISLKICSYFNYFIIKSELKPFNSLLYFNFIRALTRIVQFKLFLIFRSLMNSSINHFNKRNSLSNITISKDIVKVELCCFYFSKIIQTFILYRLTHYFNRIYRYSSKNLKRYVLYKPIDNIVNPLDFFLTPC